MVKVVERRPSGRALRGYHPKFQAAALDGSPVPAHRHIRNGEAKRLGERVGLEAQSMPVIPHRLEPLAVELEAFRIGRRILAVARLVEADVEGEAVAQPEETQVVLQALELLPDIPARSLAWRRVSASANSASASLPPKRRTSVS